MFSEHLKNALEKYMNYVKTHISYGLMEQQQIARCNLKTITIEQDKTYKNLDKKHLTYNNIYNSVYFVAHSDFLTTGERLGRTEMMKLRYKLFTIKELSKKFQNTIEIFHDGYKIPYDEIRIALFDDYFIVEVPEKYEKYNTLDVLVHTYGFTEIYKNNEIEISKKKINDDFKNKNDFLVFINHKQSNNFSIIENEDSYNIRCFEEGETYEIVYIPYLNYYGKSYIENSHINIMDVKRKFPIAANNIITFNKGLFINLGLTAKTDGIFKSSLNINDELDLFYVYKDYDFESAYYNDQYRWLATYLDNFMEIINDPDQLPEFAQKFELFRKDISLQDFLEKHYTNIDKYNHDKTNDTIDFCEECLLTFSKFLQDEYSDTFITKKYYTDLSKIDRASLIRTDNKSEIKEEKYQTEFKEKMFLIAFSNKKKYPYNIYINGIRFYDYLIEYNEAGYSYVYVRADQIPENAFIEVEVIRTKLSLPKKTLEICDGTDKLIIPKLSEFDFFSNENEYKNISIARPVEDNSRYINDDENIKSLEVKDDSLIITFNNPYPINTGIEVYNLSFYKEYKNNTRTESDKGYDIDLIDLESCIFNKNHIRVFKNGKELPREFYSIEFPSEDNDLKYPKIHLNISYAIYELITVEYIPDEYEEMYFREKLELDGKVDILHPEGIPEKFMSEDLNYYTLNGIRVTPYYHKFWCSKGITLYDYNSVYFFTVMMLTNRQFREDLQDFINQYSENKKLLDEYILSLMNGALNERPLHDTDPKVTEPDYTRAGKLYADLYQEFLKLNIINDDAIIPEYIIIKYGPLIDAETNVLKIDTNMKQLYWMPLDANKKNDYDENTRKIMDLYYQLLDDFESLYIIDPSDIPDDVYEKYKELFMNNCLVLQVPNNN